MMSLTALMRTVPASVRICLGPVVLSAACAASGLAQITVYDNFGPGHEGWDYNWGMGWTVAGNNVPAQYGVEQAMAFTATDSGALSDIWVAMWYVPLDAQTDVVTLYLARNPAGQPPRPEDILEQWTITQFGSWSQWNPPQHLIGNGYTDIVEGESYWLWAVGGLTTWCGWCLNIDPGLTCPHTLRREGEGWLPIANETASAFRVDVTQTTSVPFAEVAAALVYLTAQPNPARSSAEILCSTPAVGLVTLCLIDASGRTAQTAQLLKASREPQVWRIDAASLPRGVYCVVANGPGNARYSTKLVVIP